MPGTGLKNSLYFRGRGRAGRGHTLRGQGREGCGRVEFREIRGKKAAQAARLLKIYDIFPKNGRAGRKKNYFDS